MKRELTKSRGLRLLGAIAILAILSGCGGKPNTKPPGYVSPTPAPAKTAPQPSASEPASNDLLDKGKVLFLETAGGNGCQECHGADGKGNKTIGGPDIRGKNADQILTAMENVEQMRKRNVKLTDEEVDAVVAYLQFLNK